MELFFYLLFVSMQEIIFALVKISYKKSGVRVTIEKNMTFFLKKIKKK